jgi:O-acetyl-ADP-ribose deacetylase (regulator of RNase III)
MQEDNYTTREKIEFSQIETWRETSRLLDAAKHFSPIIYKNLQTLDDEMKQALEETILTSSVDFNTDLDDELSNRVSIFAGDMTVVELDCIVNATNPTLSAYGMGANGAVYFHSREPLQMQREARRALYDKYVKHGKVHPDTTFEMLIDYNGLFMEVGEAVVTKGYRLPSKFVIHALGPGHDENAPTRDEDLALTYRNCLNLALEHNFKTIGFCCISSGKFGFPIVAAANIAIRTVREWLEIDNNYLNIDRIVFICREIHDQQIYEQLMELYFPINK